MTTELITTDNQSIPLLDDELLKTLPSKIQSNLKIHRTLRDMALKIVAFVIGSPTNTPKDTTVDEDCIVIRNSTQVIEMLYGDKSKMTPETKEIFLLIELFKKIILEFLYKSDQMDDVEFEDKKLKFFITFDDFIPGILTSNVANDLILVNNTMSFLDFIYYITLHNNSTQGFTKSFRSLNKELKSPFNQDLLNSSIIPLYLQYDLLISIQKINICIYVLSILGFFPYGLDIIESFFLDMLGGNNEVVVNKKNNMTSYHTSFQNTGYLLAISTVEDPQNSSSEKLLAFINKSSGHSSLNPTHLVYLTKLLRHHVNLLLELKTQIYISSIQDENLVETTSDGEIVIQKHVASQKLDEIFNLEEIKDNLVERKKVHNQQIFEITPIEQEFLNRCQNRKQHLLQFETLESLSAAYKWYDYLNDFIKFLQKRYYSSKAAKSIESLTKPTLSSVPSTPVVNSVPSTPGIATAGANSKSATPNPLSSNVSLSTPQETGHATPISVIKAVATSKPKQKNLWTTEEEDTLLQALKVCGPQWSKILYLFGPGGQISEKLKNRTQVQLKDKSRNWKMFFLKTSIPVPPYLETVTGGIERSATGGNKTKVQKAKLKPIKKTTIRMDLNKFKFNDSDFQLCSQMSDSLNMKSFITKHDIDTDSYNKLLDKNNPLNNL